VGGIRQVVNIATANPDFAIICSGLVAVPEVTAHLKISISPFS